MSRLPTADGRTVITLMSDPSQVDPLTGEPAGFLSLVGAGANQRVISVAKADPDSPAPQVPIFTAAHGGAGPDTSSWWRGVFGPLLALPAMAMKALGLSTVKKDGEPTDFNAALAAEALNRARWQATDALWEVIGNILEDATIVDKRTAISVALDQFRAHILDLVDRFPVTKAEDATALALAMKAAPIGLPSDPTIAQKAGKVISAANMDTIQSALTALEATRAALSALLTANEKAAKAADPLSTPDPEAPAMDPIKLAAIATAAAETAVKVAKAAGVTDPARLQAVALEASAAVFKGAVMGPAQAALPTGELPRQLGQGSSVDGSMSDPETMIAAIVGRLGPQIDAMVAKAVKPATDKVDGLETVIKGVGEPGKEGHRMGLAEALILTTERVAKLAETPNRPRGAGDPETARKSDGSAWKGSAFDFTATRPG
jgi:hypothetical protein